MSGLKITLFGKFHAERQNRAIQGMEALKVQELFSYLLIHRNHPHPREVLAELLWDNQPSIKSKRYLRQTLWQLRTALNPERCTCTSPEILVETKWVQINPAADYWLDIAEFERVYAQIENVHGRKLNYQDFTSLKDAAALYQGNLLEGWYQDWCLFERERYQMMYLKILDCLINYCEAHQEYETGIVYVNEVLRCDRASEHAYRQMMRMYCAAGDRTQAMRQYEKCTKALREELGVSPSHQTVQIYEQIKADDQKYVDKYRSQGAKETDSLLIEALCCLQQLGNTLNDVQLQVQKRIKTIERALQIDE